MTPLMCLFDTMDDDAFTWKCKRQLLTHSWRVAKYVDGLKLDACTYDIRVCQLAVKELRKPHEFLS